MVNLTVTVRVWAADKLNSARNSTSTMGHVSLETHFGGDVGRLGHTNVTTNAVKGSNTGYYISFWPGVCLKRHHAIEKVRNSKIDHIVCKETGDHFHTWDQDRDLTRTEPSSKSSSSQDNKLTVSVTPIELKMFTEEQVKRINAAFEAFTQRSFRWHKTGARDLTSADLRNGSGLVEDLLNLGGIYRFAPHHAKSFTRLMFGNYMTATALLIVSLWSIYSIVSLAREEKAGSLESLFVKRILKSAKKHIYIIQSSAKQLIANNDHTVQSVAKEIQGMANAANDDLLTLGNNKGWGESVTKVVTRIAKGHALILGFQGLGLAAIIYKIRNYFQFNMVTSSDIATIAKNAKEQYEKEQAKGPPQQRYKKLITLSCTGGVGMFAVCLLKARWFR